MKKIILAILFLSTLSSCSTLLSKLYGVNNLKKFDKEKYNHFITSIEHTGIEIKSFYADTTSYLQIRNLTKNPVVKKTLSQPVQILYFDKNEKLTSIQANCYAKGGLGHLNWNTNGRFNYFIPTSAINIKKEYLSIKDFTACYPNKDFELNKDYTIIIYWSLILKKISKDAISTVINNIRKFNKSDDVIIYLVNNDKSLIRYMNS